MMSDKSSESNENNLVWHQAHVTIADRIEFFRQIPLTVWFTGLSGAGKSTLAFALEKRLLNLGQASYVLDGDNVRHGLNNNLGFSHADRAENIRRIAEVARLMNDAGLIVITAFISPFREDREVARRIIGADKFIEVHVSTPLTVCEERDPKGMYKRARAGKIQDFTGISSPYESPLEPVLSLDTSASDITTGVEAVLAILASRIEL